MISRPNPQVIEMSGFVGIDSENGLTIQFGLVYVVYPAVIFGGAIWSQG